MNQYWRRIAGRILRQVRLYDVASTVIRRRRYRHYARWIELQEPALASAQAVADPLGPTFSIIVPTHKYTAHYLDPLIASVLAQTYEQWELIIVNACEVPADAAAVERATRQDARIKHIKLEQNLHISGNTNAGIAAASGNYISFLDHDDVIAPFALNEMARALVADPAIDVIYSDEDKLSDNGKDRSHAFFKPDFSQELILTSNYICHFLTVRTTLVRRVGGLRDAFNGAQDYDLVLRLLDHKPKFCHVPSMSYHWRMAASSTAVVISEKNYAAHAGQAALQEYLRRHQIQAEVKGVAGQATAYRLSYPVQSSRRILIATNDARYGESFRLISGAAVAVSTPQELPILKPYDVVVVLSEGLEPLADNTLDELIGRALQSGVGLVAAAVEDEHGLAPLGYVYERECLKLLVGQVREPEFTYLGLSSWPRSFVAVPPLAFAFSPAAVPSSQGLDLSTPAIIIKLALVLDKAGLSNVFWPYARFRRGAHTPSLPTTLPIPSPIVFTRPDPHFNPNLTVRHERPSLKSE